MSQSDKDDNAQSLALAAASFSLPPMRVAGERGVTRATSMPKATAMLLDASLTIAESLRALRQVATQGELTPKQAQQLLHLLTAMEKVGELEGKLTAELKLEALDDATLAERTQAALQQLQTPKPK